MDEFETLNSDIFPDFNYDLFPHFFEESNDGLSLEKSTS